MCQLSLRNFDQLLFKLKMLVSTLNNVILFSIKPVILI